MKLYRIKKWNERYENNRSRAVKDLAWVPISNRHDGEGYSIVMAHPKAAEIFTAWVLMLQVASRCQPRGSLVRDNGKPLTADALAMRTRAKAEWFTLALEVLQAEDVDWIEAVEVPDLQASASGCQEGATQPTVPCHPGDEEQKGTEQNGKEGDGTPNPPEGDLAGRISSWFHRRPNTKWTEKELKALKTVAKLTTPPEDLALLEAYYTAAFPQGEDFRRQDLITLLNHWNGEIDRARRWKEQPTLIAHPRNPGGATPPLPQHQTQQLDPATAFKP